MTKLNYHVGDGQVDVIFAGGGYKVEQMTIRMTDDGAKITRYHAEPTLDEEQ